MGAAPERTILIDQASAALTFEERTVAIGMLRHRFSAGASKSLGRNDGFAFRKVRSATSQFEMATFGAANAISLDRPLRQIGVNLPHLLKRALQFFGVKDPAIHGTDAGSTPAMA